MKLRAALAATTALVSAGFIDVRPAAALAPSAPGGAVFVIMPGGTATSATVAMQIPNGVPIPIGTLNSTTGIFMPSDLGPETARATAAEGVNATAASNALATAKASVQPGSDMSPNKAAVVNGTLRTFAARAADAINSRDLGAVCDGSSHPISGLTTFNGAVTSSWTLAQWQSVYPFVTALTNEVDQVAIVAAQGLALNKGVALHINPGPGKCRGNFSPVISPAPGQAVTVFGDGPATQLAVEGSATFLAYAMPANTSGSASEMLFKDFTAYQDQAVLAGSAVVINGPTSGGGLPVATFINTNFGQNNLPVNQGGAFASSVNLIGLQRSVFINPKFYGAVNYGLSGDGIGVIGIGVTANGNSPTELQFGPYFINPECDHQNICALIGDGTNAFVQGVKFQGGTVVAANQLVKWHATGPSQNDDYLSINGMDIESYGTAVDTDNVLTVSLVGNYFIARAGTVLAQLTSTANQAQEFTVVGNTFGAYGQQNAIGLLIGPTTAQVGDMVSNNLFFDFNSSGSLPINEPSGTNNLAFSGNSFGDSNAPVDVGANNWANSLTTKTSGTNYLYTTGVPVTSPTQPGSSASSPAVAISRTPIADQAKNVYVPTSAGTHMVAGTTSWQVYNPAGTLATLTTTMPAGPVDGQEVTFTTSQTITAWTLQANTGQTIQGAPPSLTSGNMVTFRWNVNFGAWQARNGLVNADITPNNGLVMAGNQVVVNGASFTLGQISPARQAVYNGAQNGTFQLPAANRLASARGYMLQNSSQYLLSVTVGSGNAINGSTNSVIVLRPGDAAFMQSDGNVNWTPFVFGKGTKTAGAGLTAAGTSNTNAYAMTKDVSAFTTVASGSGAILSGVIGQDQQIYNRGANALLVYPPFGAAIESGAATTGSVSIPVGGHNTFECVSATQCYQAP